MKLFNQQFGELEYDEKHVIFFPNGIIGFENCHKFVLVTDEEILPFRWLISLDDDSLGFPVLEPGDNLPYYTEYISKGSDVIIFVIATLRENIEESTVNLRSPIVINDIDRSAEQIILDDESYSMRHPLIPSVTQT